MAIPAPNARFQVRNAHVAARLFDGEAVIMNLANSMYYSAHGLGAVAWQVIATGVPLDRAAAGIADHYGIDRDTAWRHLADFAAYAVDEELVRDAGDIEGQNADSLELPAGEYAPPTMTRYDDMAELLALDPPIPEDEQFDAEGSRN